MYTVKEMNILQDINLAAYSTMRLGGNAAYLVEVATETELKEAAAWAAQNSLPVLMIGSGSNIVWRDEGYPGLVIVDKISGFEVKEDEFGTYLSVGAGENWDSVVLRSVDLGLTGIECLTLIPGSAGATPIQNVGAYGQEISQTLVTLSAYNFTTGMMETLAAGDCQFSYRNSIFKTNPGKYLITSITLMLRKGSMMPPFYPSLNNYLNEHHVTDCSPASIRQAVMAIRQNKLPDPSKVANCGSFFGNPEVDKDTLSVLQENYPGIPNWPTDSGKAKLSAAWLIDQAGFAHYTDQETGIATWPQQPLVFINQGAKSTAALLSFADKVKSSVLNKFGVELNQEPLLLP